MPFLLGVPRNHGWDRTGRTAFKRPATLCNSKAPSMVIHHRSGPEGPQTARNKHFCAGPSLGSTGQPGPSGPAASRVVREAGLGASLGPFHVQSPSTWRGKRLTSRAEPASKATPRPPHPASCQGQRQELARGKGPMRAPRCEWRSVWPRVPGRTAAGGDAPPLRSSHVTAATTWPTPEIVGPLPADAEARFHVSGPASGLSHGPGGQ